MLRTLLVALVLFALPAVAHAGKYNPTLNIGDKAPNFSKLPGTDGKEHSLGEFAERDVLVLFFTCNSCEYAVDYEDRIIAIAKKYAGEESNVAFVGVNVNRIAADSLEKMQEKAEKKGFPFVYLYDDTQQIAHDYGASTTPEFFVFDGDRKLVYMGSLDDNSDAAKAKVNYLQLAINAALDGAKPETTETVPIGCLVRYDRRRMKK